MNKSMYGSLDFTKLVEEFKKGNACFKKADNGKVYFNFKLWLNEEPDKFNNNGSLQSSYTKDRQQDKFYFGNLKWSESKQATAPAQNDSLIDDLPF